MKYKNYIICKVRKNDYYVTDLEGNVIFSRQESAYKCKCLIDKMEA